MALASAPCGLRYGNGSYEIQVYGSELVSPGATVFELHSNFTIEGSKTVVDGPDGQSGTLGCIPLAYQSAFVLNSSIASRMVKEVTAQTGLEAENELGSRAQRKLFIV